MESRLCLLSSLASLMFVSPPTAPPSHISAAHHCALHHSLVMNVSLHQIRTMQCRGETLSSLRPKRWGDSVVTGGRLIHNQLRHVALMSPPSMFGISQTLLILKYPQQNIGTQQPAHQMRPCRFTSFQSQLLPLSPLTFQVIGNISTPSLGIRLV